MTRTIRSALTYVPHGCSVLLGVRDRVRLFVYFFIVLFIGFISFFDRLWLRPKIKFASNKKCCPLFTRFDQMSDLISCFETKVASLFRVWKNSRLLRRFQWFNVHVDFFEFFSTELAACLKLSSRDNHRKSVSSKDVTTWPGCGFNPDRAIEIVVKAKPLLSLPRFSLP